MARIQGDLRIRTFEFAVRILKLIDELPNTTKGWEIGRQMIRSGTGIGANVREADNALSDRDFVLKCSIARKEASETHYWLELCQRAALLSGERVEFVLKEADEITKVLSSIVKKSHHYLSRVKSKS